MGGTLGTPLAELKSEMFFSCFSKILVPLVNCNILNVPFHACQDIDWIPLVELKV